MGPILEVKNLRKTYLGRGSKESKVVTAVNGVNFSLTEGICFGLLGPNGAGKTTTVEMMEGILAPTAGEILFRGEPIGKHYREKIGIQFQETSLQDYIRVREVLELFASFYPKRANIDELVRLCDLKDLLGRDVHQLSGGQRQRVLLALALVNDPELVFLDEPTTGLDPQARRNFWELVRQIRARHCTVVLTTHYMDEAHELCDEIGIMDEGKLIERGTPDDLLERHSCATLEDLFLTLTGRKLRG